MSEFKITGPGYYKTRDGHMVKVSSRAVAGSNYKWQSTGHPNAPQKWLHCDDGRLFDDGSNEPEDIISSWDGPVLAEKPTPAMPLAVPQPQTTRDWFAGQALVGLCADPSNHALFSSKAEAAENAYKMADAMMDARSKGNGAAEATVEYRSYIRSTIIPICEKLGIDLDKVTLTPGGMSIKKFIDATKGDAA